MKYLFVIGAVLLAQAWTLPLEKELSCDDILPAEACEQFDAIDELVMNEYNDEEVRERRQLPPTNPDLLEQLLRKKLEFLINFGLLQNIPFIGKVIHDMVANDPDGVAKALAGGLGGLIQLVLKVIGGGIGR